MTFQELFVQSKGQPIFYEGKKLQMIDKIQLTENLVYLKLTFISTDSRWKQGVILDINGEFEINGKKITNKIIIWEDTAPKEVHIAIKSKDKILAIYNAWDTGDGTTHYWYNGGAMYIEEIEGARVYHCNDGYPDDDINDLIFKIEFLKE